MRKSQWEATIDPRDTQFGVRKNTFVEVCNVKAHVAHMVESG
jgi:hypothetical protein